MKTIRKSLTACAALACSVVMLGAMHLPASATTLYGDVNGDGSINLSDSIALSKFLSGQCELSNYDAADVNANYIVDSVDVKILNAFLTHSITSLPYLGT